MVGSLVAAPLVGLVGLSGAIVGTGLLSGGYALAVALPRRAAGRHRAARQVPEAVEAVQAVQAAEAVEAVESMAA
ncbi:MAG: transporter [Blastococcus sp.]|nr:transporter [Blastococcus sp.]